MFSDRITLVGVLFEIMYHEIAHSMALLSIKKSATFVCTHCSVQFLRVIYSFIPVPVKLGLSFTFKQTAYCEHF